MGSNPIIGTLGNAILRGKIVRIRGLSACERSRTKNAVHDSLIEIRPHRNGWKCFEAPGVVPVFLRKMRRLITRSAARAFAPARFAFSIQAVQSHAQFHLTRRIEDCNTKGTKIGGCREAQMHCSNVTRTRRICYSVRCGNFD